MQVQPQANPVDPISQSAAAKMVGKSVDTIRRWRKSGRLQSWQEGGSTSPVLLSKSEVWQLAGLDTVQASAPLHSTSDEALLREVQQQRDHYRSKAYSLEEDNKQLRVELADVRTRVAVLQAELNHQADQPIIRGLLTGAAKKISERLGL